MKVISVNVGKPRIVLHNGKEVSTGIYKGAVGGPVAVTELCLTGDGQADLKVHGGREKAVYVYPHEHYDYWRKELPGTELPFGIFGENLTTEGLLEAEVRPGDLLSIGTAKFKVTEPRYPCFKLGIRFDRTDMLRRFAKSGRSGFYLSVEQTGELSAGASIEHTNGSTSETIEQIFNERMKAKQ